MQTPDQEVERVDVFRLQPLEHSSPLPLSTKQGDGVPNFLKDEHRIEVYPHQAWLESPVHRMSFEQAGPRQDLFFDPSDVRAAIVTCGGLCPGLNNVIRSIAVELEHQYKAKEVIGLRFGYQGLNPEYGHEPLPLETALVDEIHKLGGTILGSSRGNQPVEVMVDYLVDNEIDILFCIGGDGTLRGAHAIHEEIARRGLRKAVVGVPKTIDNDICFCTRSFGFSTAIGKANEVVQVAHVEAKGSPRGIGLVKLMGRNSGFIAVGATLTSQMVNYVLVPEVPFRLEGENGLLSHLRDRMSRKRHAVIVVAEGAGQDFFQADEKNRDASGNIRLQDIGVFLRDRIKDYFSEIGEPIDMKYIDPSYVVRGAPANADDSFLCDQMARNAVHAAMAGRSDVFIGFVNNFYVHVPIVLGTRKKQQIDPESFPWQSALAATGQPAKIGY